MKEEFDEPLAEPLAPLLPPPAASVCVLAALAVVAVLRALLGLGLCVRGFHRWYHSRGLLLRWSDKQWCARDHVHR